MTPSDLFYIATAMLVAAIYMLPTIVAGVRDHPQGNAIMILNLFLGWTFIVWVVALAWSATAIKMAPRADELVTRGS